MYKKVLLKFSLFIFIFGLITCLPMIANANEQTTTIQRLSVEDALANPEIYNVMLENDEIDELIEAQNSIRDSFYHDVAMYISESKTDDVSPIDVEQICKKYGLNLPNENDNGIINEGTIYVQRNANRDIVDVWYIYYSVSDTGFSVNAALVDVDNPLDSVSGTMYLYKLNNESWSLSSSKPFSANTVRNGTIYKWSKSKDAVKEKFEYSTTVIDNGGTHNYDNSGEDDYFRYNFVAGPYGSLYAKGGQRHHFIPAYSLNNNGFDSSTAYCIRMMTADHKKTASYGSPSHVATITSLLASNRYEDAIQTEVDSLQTKPDTDGIYDSLADKYVYEIIDCIYAYELLFGII